MPNTYSLITFALIALGMALVPGPNMIYLISRSICQGRAAGFISLAGVALGFVFYMLCMAFGITALVFAIPYAYDLLRFGGAIYLLWLAWNALNPGGASPLQIRNLPKINPNKLFLMGFATKLLNPKIAMLYLSLLPQFIDPTKNSVFSQSIVLGGIQIMIGVSVNAAVTFAAANVAQFLKSRPIFAYIQRWLMGTVLAGLAVRMMLDGKR